MRRWLRQHRYAFAIATRRLVLQPFSTLANLLVIALTLSVPIVGAAILTSAQPVVREVPVSPEITIFLQPTAPEDAKQNIAQRLKTEHANDIRASRIVDRSDALTKLKSNPNWADALAALPENPLPDSIIVTLAEHDNLAEHAEHLVKQWQNWENVSLVQHDSAWVQRLDALLRFLRIGIALLAIGVALVVLATVFNTVRMQALVQREEIAAARLVGATESFVRRPFLYLGALTGLLASFLAIIFSTLALLPLNRALASLASSYGTHLSLKLPASTDLIFAVVIVAILAALSARLSVTRNTRF